MKAVVVYESHWGNTAAVAHAVAEGIGPGAQALSTAQASAAVVSAADLIVAGAPVLGFSLPTDSMLKGLTANPGGHPTPPDLSHPSMRTWLDALPRGIAGSTGRPTARSAAFETRISWSPGGATTTIERELDSAGYRPIAKAARFIVSGKYGPLRAGELERARLWGAELAQLMR